MLPNYAYEFLPLLFLGLAVLTLPLVALIDILISKFENNDKLVWLLVVICFNLLGVLLYLLIGRRRRVREE